MWWTVSATTTIAALALISIGLTANWGYPHGPSVPTGDFDCANDGRGPCGEIYTEDLDAIRDEVPGWVITVRDWELGPLDGFLAIFGIVGLAKTTGPTLQRLQDRRMFRRYERWEAEFLRVNGRRPSEDESGEFPG